VVAIVIHGHRAVSLGLCCSLFLSTTLLRSTNISPDSSAKVYADDLKAYVGTDGGQHGVDIFSTTLLSIENWACTWQLPISGSKPYYMHISNKILVKYDPVFRLANCELVKVTKIKDLRVIFNNNLSFTDHITSIIGKAKQRLYLLSKILPNKRPYTSLFWLTKLISCLFVTTVPQSGPRILL